METTMSAVTWDPQPSFTLPARPSTGGLRLTRRGRAVLSAVAVLVTLGAVFTAQRADAEGAGAATAVVTHTVVAGETLWAIASSVAAPGEDLRDVVDRIMELNGLQDGGLRSGQQILVPAGS